MVRHRTREFPAPNPVELGIFEVLGYPYDGTGSTYVENYTFEPTSPFQSDSCIDELHPGPPYKTGGPFDKTSYTTDWWTPKAWIDVKNGIRSRHTFHIPGRVPHLYLEAPGTSWGDVSSYGAKGWNNYRPTRPSIDLGVALRELREVPQMLKSTCKDFVAACGPKLRNPKQLGEEWLNFNFGWLPFLNDIRSFAKAVKDLDKRLKQLYKDNGKWVYRGGPVLSTTDTTVLEDSTNWGFFPGYYIYLADRSGATSSRRFVTLTESQDIWFSARFRYHIPATTDFLWKAKAYAMLFGMMPTPSMVWELTPWSWLIDWCSNAGDIVEYISSITTQDLCAKYAYIMGKTLKRVDYYGQANYYGGNVVTGNWYAQYERKQRVPASQFGFSLTDTDFSVRQWSILAALGLSRL